MAVRVEFAIALLFGGLDGDPDSFVERIEVAAVDLAPLDGVGVRETIRHGVLEVLRVLPVKGDVSELSGKAVFGDGLGLGEPLSLPVFGETLGNLFGALRGVPEASPKGWVEGLKWRLLGRRAKEPKEQG